MPNKDTLDQPVTIHFKENSIPSLRGGVLTNESVNDIIDWIVQEIEDCAKSGISRDELVDKFNSFRKEGL